MTLDIECTVHGEKVSFLISKTAFNGRKKYYRTWNNITLSRLGTTHGSTTTWIIPLAKQGLMHIEIPLEDNWKFVGLTIREVVQLAEKTIANNSNTKMRIFSVPPPCYRENGITYTEVEWELRNKVKNLRYFFFDE